MTIYRVPAGSKYREPLAELLIASNSVTVQISMNDLLFCIDHNIVPHRLREEREILEDEGFVHSVWFGMLRTDSVGATRAVPHFSMIGETSFWVAQPTSRTTSAIFLASPPVVVQRFMANLFVFD